jgi:hypothetical protein
MALKPEVSITIAAATSAVVYGVFYVEVGHGLSDVKNAQPHNSVIQSTVTTAAWTSAAIVAGISLLSKDPTIFVVGGAVAAALTWKYKHANMVNPANGQVTFPPQQNVPQQNQAAANNQGVTS